jgi:hypothetical protein
LLFKKLDLEDKQRKIEEKYEYFDIKVETPLDLFYVNTNITDHYLHWRIFDMIPSKDMKIVTPVDPPFNFDERTRQIAQANYNSAIKPATLWFFNFDGAGCNNWWPIKWAGFHCGYNLF